MQQNNCLDLVESWQDNILYSDFAKNRKEDYYSAKIYFIQEFGRYKYFVKVYKYSYLVEHKTFFVDDYQVIAIEILQQITEFESLVSSSKEKFLFNALQDFQK